MNNLQNMKQQYHDIPLPKELSDAVQHALHQNRSKKSWYRPLLLTAVAILALFIGSINLSSSFANQLASVPLMSSVVEVFSVQDIERNYGDTEVAVSKPVITGFNDKQFEQILNEKYEEENRELFKSTSTEKGRISLDRQAVVLTDTENVLSIARYTTVTQGGSAQSIAIDNIDPHNEWVITLPSLFKDNTYIPAISSYIYAQIEQREDRLYFTDEEGSITFNTIDANQTFSITKDGQLTIYFDEYTIAAGAAGIVEFTIPTDVIKPSLMSNYYIK
ncbi:anti-sigma-V factor RsiV [Lysinibacillus alkalisoli]|uniref:Anti-sigma-V factor RsiV n=1 Tax=Lysinibacillus alkalisoli TaxID=1911548 RepID=A0A917LDT5_9BACI|nr:RsiV family protein [Lysinibacillus alkalisoli]GGG15192.1 anti-sigma-V factor RsiV [Lysinibacillus alkalisoli]